MSSTLQPVQPVQPGLPNYIVVKQKNSGFALLGKLLVAYIVFVIVVAAVFAFIAASSHKSENFGSMIRVPDHTGIMNRPDIIDSELNWQKKYNQDNLTADEYYDDRVYNHAGHISAPKHPRDFKHPGTGTQYRKFMEKSAN